MTESQPTRWTIDPSHSLVEFSVKHMMITTVKGRFASLSGELVLEGENPGATVSIDAASVDTRTADRDTHLRSADFFDVENHPTIDFRSLRVEGGPVREGGSFKVVGELTIVGKTREVVIDATFDGTGTDPWGGTRASFSGSTKLDRRDFGLTWNQALEAGGVLVSNEIKVSLEVQAVKG